MLVHYYDLDVYEIPLIFYLLEKTIDPTL
jgi:hypothetical protein